MWCLAFCSRGLRILGFPIVFDKAKIGSIMQWIGVELRTGQDCVIAVAPAEKIKELILIIDGFLARNVLPIREVRSYVGKAMHIASVIFLWRPFLSEVWPALSADSSHGGTAAPLNCIWTKQVVHSLTWMRAFLVRQAGTICRKFMCDAYMRRGDRIEITTDASPYGIGGTLEVNGVLVEYFHDDISEHDRRVLGFTVNVADGQQAWEALAILVAMRLWRSRWQSRRVCLSVQNDNIGALTVLARLKAKSAALNLCARELALELADGTFLPDIIEHILGVTNVLADYLSRRRDPSKFSTWRLPGPLQAARLAACEPRPPRWWQARALGPSDANAWIWGPRSDEVKRKGRLSGVSWHAFGLVRSWSPDLDHFGLRIAGVISGCHDCLTTSGDLPYVLDAASRWSDRIVAWH